MDNKNFIGPAVKEMKRKGTVGSLTRAASRFGMSPMSFARKTMASPSASPAMKKKANFAINAAGK